MNHALNIGIETEPDATHPIAASCEVFQDWDGDEPFLVFQMFQLPTGPKAGMVDRLLVAEVAVYPTGRVDRRLQDTITTVQPAAGLDMHYT